MNVGDMQRKLSQWAEQDKARQFYDLYDFLYDQDWLRVTFKIICPDFRNYVSPASGEVRRLA
jgi:hypothetical protein